MGAFIRTHWTYLAFWLGMFLLTLVASGWLLRVVVVRPILDELRRVRTTLEQER